MQSCGASLSLLVGADGGIASGPWFVKEMESDRDRVSKIDTTNARRLVGDFRAVREHSK